ncbi:hypothetical protein [Paraburkholderia diazotrophica]|uniref:Uncharacterized protein n=1 Tax=Paraburkholderia diazotrophica TaxID=667676 RepID=A0A1H6YT99_9BURK|nr:hypothetical protein [Paraburkholderia diazotrophica]SEJ44523.1 hypothetical protein SAMN05192539_101154 [Paraburkholderia diazotrophica]
MKRNSTNLPRDIVRDMVRDPARGAVRNPARESARPPMTLRARNANSTFRAFQAAPLSRLASNGNEHAHVRTAAILGYN